MASWIQTSCMTMGLLFVISQKLYSQDNSGNDKQSNEPSTIILFRTFDIFSFDRSYKLYAGDSLLGRIKTHDVIIVDTYDKGITFHATTRALSLNAGKRTNHIKTKKTANTITLKSGQVYFVKCGYVLENLFDLPRKPKIKRLTKEEIEKHLKRRFLRRKIKAYLYKGWLNDKNLTKLDLKK